MSDSFDATASSWTRGRLLPVGSLLRYVVDRDGNKLDKDSVKYLEQQSKSFESDFDGTKSLKL